MNTHKSKALTTILTHGVVHHMSQWITTTEALTISGYHRVYLYELIRTKKVKARKFGTVWQVDHNSLLAYVNAAAESGDRRHGARAKRTTPTDPDA